MQAAISGSGPTPTRSVGQTSAGRRGHDASGVELPCSSVLILSQARTQAGRLTSCQGGRPESRHHPGRAAPALAPASLPRRPKKRYRQPARLPLRPQQASLTAVPLSKVQALELLTRRFEW